MINYLSTSVQSYYNVWDKAPKNVELGYLLHLAPKYLRKEIKQELPCFQPSAMSFGRTTKDVYNHTGLVQLDYDFKDNPELQHDSVRQRLIDDLIATGNVVCAQTSTSGRGVWALVAVAGINKDNHSELAEALCDDMTSRFNYLPDRPTSKKLAGLRFLSHHTDLCINTEAEPIELDTEAK